MAKRTDIEMLLDGGTDEVKELLVIYDELDQAFQEENDLEAWNLAMSFAARCKPILEKIVNCSNV